MPVSEPQEAKDFHKLGKGEYRTTYLHPGRNLIVTDGFLHSLHGSLLSSSLKDIASQVSIILGKDDPYLPGWQDPERIKKYENMGYTIKTHGGNHYPQIFL